MSSRGVDVDFQAALCFKDRKDPRDQRPLLYPLWVVRPYVEAAAMDVDDDGTENRKVKPHPGVQFWQSSRLVRTGRTEDAEQVPNAALKVRAGPKSAFQPSSDIVSFLVFFCHFLLKGNIDIFPISFLWQRVGFPNASF